MREFRWNQENEVFLSHLDAEHRDLFQVADGLQQAILGGTVAAGLRPYIQKLSDHLEEHFSHEEWLMQSVRYPSYAWHKQQHEAARRRMKLFIPLIESGDAEAADVFLDFLAGWLHDHTSLTDRMLAAYVRNYERAHSPSTAKRAGAAGRPTAADGGRPFPKTMHLCGVCGGETPHELRAGEMICVTCAERAVRAERNRE
ncbi:MAG TPA: hemerythrin family protein [Bryobacteraceae bacterium]|nr:hemerythrin family protein [Bryobacteraceae bacterium]